MGLNSIDWLVKYGQQKNSIMKKIIAKNEFNNFLKEAVIFRLRDENFGDKFQERFGILDFFIAFQNTCDSKLEAYIRKEYVEK